MTKTYHIGYDDGAIAEAIEEVTGIPALLYQKTTKTRCGTRTGLERIDNRFPSCIANREEEEASASAMMSEIGEALGKEESDEMA